MFVAYAGRWLSASNGFDAHAVWWQADEIPPRIDYERNGTPVMARQRHYFEVVLVLLVC